MSTAAHFTLDHFEHMVNMGAFSGAFQKRVELLRGEIVEMTPIHIAHSNCVTLVTEWSYEVVPRDRIMVRSQNPIRIPVNDSEPEPDVVWVKRKKYARHPEPGEILLLVEVADSSLEFDRTDKLEVYAEAGIVEYWIVNLRDEQVEVFRKPRAHAFQERSIYRGQEVIRPLNLATVELSAGRLFVP